MSTINCTRRLASRRSVTTILLVTVGLVVGTLTGTGPAQAASGVPTVCGRACDGKDPQTFVVPNSGGWTCVRDARTIYHKDFPPSWVELRYSPSCRTAWSRKHTGAGDVYTGIAGFSYYTNGQLRATVYAGGPSTGGDFYTAMLDDANLIFKACMDLNAAGPPNWSCTSGY
jgi:hypothetical protein